MVGLRIIVWNIVSHSKNVLVALLFVPCVRTDNENKTHKKQIMTHTKKWPTMNRRSHNQNLYFSFVDTICQTLSDGERRWLILSAHGIYKPRWSARISRFYFLWHLNEKPSAIWNWICASFFIKLYLQSMKQSFAKFKLIFEWITHTDQWRQHMRIFFYHKIEKKKKRRRKKQKWRYQGDATGTKFRLRLSSVDVKNGQNNKWIFTLSNCAQTLAAANICYRTVFLFPFLFIFIFRLPQNVQRKQINIAEAFTINLSVLVHENNRNAFVHANNDRPESTNVPANEKFHNPHAVHAQMNAPMGQSE